jgi:hypothetical protein
VVTEQEAGWLPEAVWALCERERSFALSEKRTLVPPVCLSSVTIPTELLRFLQHDDDDKNKNKHYYYYSPIPALAP